MTEYNVLDMQRGYGGMRPKRNWRGKPQGQRLTYVWKKRPYQHQLDAVKKLLSTGFGGGLLMEPRTGKTKVAVDYASILHAAGKVSRVVVLCPVNAIGVWMNELEANCPYPYRLTVWDRKTRKRTNLELPRYGDNVLDFLVVNYDALSTPGAIRKRDEEGNIIRSRSRGGRFDIKKKLKLWQPDLIILDESHRIKSPSARKATMAHSLGKIATYRLIMTGTVVTKRKRLIDIWSQWEFLNPSRFHCTFGEFKSTYARFANMNGYQKWLRNLNEEQLHGFIHLDSFSITREECYDLPKQTHQVIPVELTDEESGDIYDEMAREMVAQIKNGELTEASIQLTLGIRLRQITSGLARTTTRTEQFPNGKLMVIGAEKLRVIQSRLEDLLEEDEKIVIGALWKADIYRIEKMLRQMKVPTYKIQGGMRHTDRTYNVAQFHKVQGGAVFIGQPAAAGEAIDLSCASIMQWYSLTPSWVNFRQFSDRIALSDKPTFFEYYLARGTVDELLYQTLQEDGNLGKKMITSPQRLLRLGSEWDR